MAAHPCAALAYREVGGRATQDAKADAYREVGGRANDRLHSVSAHLDLDYICAAAGPSCRCHVGNRCDVGVAMYTRS